MATGTGTDRRGGARAVPLAVSGGDGIHVVHREGEPLAFPADTAEALRDGPAGQATVLVAARVETEEFDELAEQLAPVLEASLAAGVRLLRLVMSGGAADRAEAPAPARRICEAWGIDVIAPSGVAVIVPGGTLFAPDRPGTVGGWWYFSPGLVPRRLGTRLPTPAWEGPLERVDPQVADGHLVEPVPAGLLVQPLGARLEGIDAIRYAVPADTARPMLLVGVPGSPPVSSDALASVLAALPGRMRDAVRLLPGDGRDLLRTGQEVADALGLEVHVGNGLPVLLEQDSTHSTARVLLVGADGTPSWQPYVAAVTCVPAEGGLTPAPRVGSWRAPVTGLEESNEPGVLFLDQRWQVTLTRAGLWIGPRGSQPVAVSDRVVETDVVAIDLGVPGRALDESLWPALDRLFGSLEDDIHDRAMIQVHGNSGAEGMKTLRRLAVRHGLALAPNGWRSGTAAQAAVPVSAAPLAAPGSAVPEPTVSATDPAPATAPVTPPVPSATASGGLATGSEPAREPARRPAVSTSAAVAGSVSPDAWTAAAPPSPHAPTPAPAPAPAPETYSQSPVPEAAEGEPPHPVLPPYSGPEPVREPEPALRTDLPERSTPTPSEAQPSEPVPLPVPVPGPPIPLFTASTGLAPDDGSATPDGSEPRPEQDPEPRIGPEHRETWQASVPADPQPTALRVITYVPVKAAHHSTARERDALRSYLDADWDRHLGAVHRTLTQLPGLRSMDAQDELATDLAAVHAYVNAGEDNLRDHELRAGLERRDDHTLSFLACLASGLRRLPSFRGTAVRAAGVFGGDATLLLPGEEIGEATAVSALALDRDYPTVTEDHYLIWSMTGRRAGSLADSDRVFDQDEILFGPGTRFRVLQVRERAGASIVLLRELPENAPVAVPGQLDGSDTQVLDRLSTTADQFAPLGNSRGWPARCTGALGLLAPAPPGMGSP